jgi:hypothetical protein
MDRIKAQAAKFWQLLFAPETAATYQKAITLTGQIFRESGLLIWLTICLVLVLMEWFYQNATQAGQKARAWIDHQQAADAGPDHMASGFGKALLAAGQNSLTYTLGQAKAQLGLPIAAKPALEAAAPPPLPVRSAVAGVVIPPVED